MVRTNVEADAFNGEAMTRAEALQMEGTGWDADLDEVRHNRAAAE